MKWHAEWGSVAHMLANAGMLPDRPPPPEGYALFLRGAYEVLDRSRPQGMSARARIPLTEIDAFCRLFGVWDTDYFAKVIIAVDDAIVEHLNEIDKKKRTLNEKLAAVKARTKRSGRR